MPTGSRFLRVDDEFLRQDVQDLLVRGYRDRTRRVDDALHVAGGHFLLADGDDAVRVEAAHVTARDPGEHRVDLAAGHELGLLHGALNRLHRRVDVDDHALLQAARGVRAEPHDLDRPVRSQLPDDRHHLGGADVEPHDEVPFVLLSHLASRPPWQRRRRPNAHSSPR